jgi:CubicO group peptidase (beta-lactamase class C family)
VPPASVGLDGAKLDQIAARARQGKSNCLVVVRDGKLAGEWYFRGTGPDTTQDVFSATKSLASTLVGIAQDDGDLRIGASASKWIPQWKGTPSQAVTVRDLLSMDSGRQWSAFTDYVRLLAAGDRTAFAIGLGQAAVPGKVWAYNNSAVQTLDRILQNATRTDVLAFARRRLFEPLGMTHTTMTTDKAGNAQMFEGVRSTCRDMARFGVLMLNRGAWHGRQIVSRRWVEQATGTASSELNAGYGYLWWLNHEGVIGDVLAATSLRQAKHETRGRLVPGAPNGMYWALGLGNQVLQVDPGTRTVVVRLGTAEPIPVPPTFGPAQASEVVTQAVIRK